MKYLLYFIVIICTLNNPQNGPTGTPEKKHKPSCPNGPPPPKEYSRK